MKVISANIDGIDRAIAMGFFEWLTWQEADVVCLQELNVNSVPQRLATWLARAGYEIAASLPQKNQKGGGTAILSRFGFEDINAFPGSPLAQRGQITSGTVKGTRIASVYVSYGNNAYERAEFAHIFDEIADSWPLAILAGDFNIIAERRDSHLWYPERNNGYRPEERAWLGSLLNIWSDAVRIGLPASNEPLYTWWSNKGACYEENRGTRLDYILTSKSLTDRIIPETGVVVRETRQGKRMSDHAPLSVEFALD